jgi:hypothetical protein
MTASATVHDSHSSTADQTAPSALQALKVKQQQTWSSGVGFPS